MSAPTLPGHVAPNLYNEIEPFAAEWMRNLAQAGHIAAGVVDQRSIVDLRPADVADATQFHAFAGLGAWSYALRLAGWGDDEPVWTGSCPCQPFSSAGRKGGFDDKRHLWPAWFGLIRERRPPVVFGEQVASPDGLAWLDVVSADLEGEGYAFGAADLCAAGVGAPHIRQRLYFVAYAGRLEGRLQLSGGQARRTDAEAVRCGEASDLADAGARERRLGEAQREGAGRHVAGGRGGVGGLVDAADEQHERCSDVRREERGRAQHPSPWSDAELVPCRDGKHRPVEPGAFPLAHGATARVGRLRAYGNAIVPEVAATFIRAVMEARAA